MTLGETATIVNGFTVPDVPFIQFVTPASAAQGATLDLTVVGSLTNFTATTAFDFGPGVTVNAVTPRPHHATVNVSISPVAARTTEGRERDHRGVPQRPAPISLP